jgi:hypothetical protein
MVARILPANGKISEPKVIVFKALKEAIEVGLFDYQDRFEKVKVVMKPAFRLRMFLPRIFGEQTTYINMIVYNTLAQKLYARLRNDLNSNQRSGKDYILYSMMLEYPWILKPETVQNATYDNSGCRGSLQYTITFKEDFVEGSLPSIYPFNESLHRMEFIDRDEEIASPDVWDLSYMDNRTLARDTAAFCSPTKVNALPVKVRKVE